MQFTYLTDPGHGWVRCPLSLALELGITPRVSRYSYFQPETNDIWLEEDCDAGLLIDALRAAGIEYTLRELHVNGDAAVRSFPSWTPATAL